MSHDVFICYSARDKNVADAMCAVLEAEGVRCWIAPRDILPGADWGESIIDAINEASAMVLVFSSNANQAQSQIKREVERGVNKGIPVIPFRIENVLPTKSLEYFLSTPHWLDAFTPPLDGHVRQLADSIKRLLGKQVSDRPPLILSAPPMANLPHREGPKFDFKDIHVGGVPIKEWAKEPVHAGMLGVAALILLAGLYWIFRPTATPEDQQEWNVAAMEDSIPAYQLYTREEPSGYYRRNANDRITALTTEVSQAFDKAKAENTPAAYQSFVESYSKQGLDLEEAREAYQNAYAAENEARVAENEARNAYRRALNTHSRDGYQAFLTDYGKTSYAADVRQRLAGCHTQTETSNGVQNSEMERSATESASNPTEACSAARNYAVNQIENTCAKNNGRVGEIRTLNQNVQSGQSAGNRMAGQFLGGALFGNNGQSVNLGTTYECSTEVEVSCQRTSTSTRQADICP